MKQENKPEHIAGNYGYCGRCGQAPKEGEDCYDPKDKKIADFFQDPEVIRKAAEMANEEQRKLVENKDWREVWYTEFSNVLGLYSVDSMRIVDFIQSLLSKQEKEIREEYNRRESRGDWNIKI